MNKLVDDGTSIILCYNVYANGELFGIAFNQPDCDKIFDLALENPPYPMCEQRNEVLITCD